MRIFQEALNTEAEYKAAVMQDGEKILSVLDYIYRRNTNQVVISEKPDSEKVIDLKKLRNLAELIQDIRNDSLSTDEITPPTFNL